MSRRSAAHLAAERVAGAGRPSSTHASLGMAMGLCRAVRLRAGTARLCAESLPQWRVRGRGATVLFYVDTLDYLRRGGRIGAASAFLGSALAIKPFLSLRTGTSSRSRRCAPPPGPSAGWRSWRCARSRRPAPVASTSRCTTWTPWSGRPVSPTGCAPSSRSTPSRGARARGGGRRPRRAGHHRGRRVAPARAALLSHVQRLGVGSRRGGGGLLRGRRQPGHDRGAGAPGGPDPGSGNPGATNTGRLLGLRWGVVVGVSTSSRGWCRRSSPCCGWAGRRPTRSGWPASSGTSSRRTCAAVAARGWRPHSGRSSPSSPSSRWGWWCCSG